MPLTSYFEPMPKSVWENLPAHISPMEEGIVYRSGTIEDPSIWGRYKNQGLYSRVEFNEEAKGPFDFKKLFGDLIPNA